MKRSRLWQWLPRITPFVLALTVGSCAGDAGDMERDEDEDRDNDADSPTLRAAAKELWYNESVGPDGPRQGGPWTAEYRQFLLMTAEQERLNYPQLMRKPELPPTPDTVVPGSGTTWMSLGPTRADYLKNGTTTLNQVDSGRITSIVVDPSNPSRIFLATAGGGVWRSMDAGKTWVPIADTVGTLSTGTLAMDPSDVNTLYLGLGDAFDGTGVGLVKSKDGGNTWSAPVFLGSSTMTQQVVVAPSSSSIVLAATNKGLFRSTDAGASWTNVSLATGQTAAPFIWSIASTGGTGFALSLEANHDATTGTTDGQVFYSSDNGATWTRATSFTKASGIGRCTVASAPSSRATLYGVAAIPLSSASTDLADFFKSSDGGKTWTALGATTKRYTNDSSASVSGVLNGQGWYNQLILIHPTDPRTVYFGGALLLIKTADGGTNFSKMTDWLGQGGLPYLHADLHAGSFLTASALYIGSDGGVFKSTDGGATFSSALNTGLVTHLVYSVGSSLANKPAVIGGLQDNGTRLRSGSTSTFNQVIGGDGFGSAIHPTSSALMLGSLYYERIQKSTDGGTTWTSACSGITECNNSSTAPFYTKIIPWAGDATGNTVYTFANPRVYKSTNFAGSWTALGTTGLPTTTFNIRNVGVAKTNANIVGIVSNGGRVFLTNNGGASWTQAASPPNNGTSMSYLSFDPTDANTIYVASVAPDSTKSHLWKSTNFGVSWTAIDGGGFPHGIPVNIIRTDPGTHTLLYAGTDLGVYKSTDSGATWARFGANMPLVSVMDIYISPDSSLMRVATFGRGFWELSP